MMKELEKVAKGLLVISLAGILMAWYLPEPTSGAVTVSAEVVAGVLQCTTDLTATNFSTMSGGGGVYTAGDNSTTTVESNGALYMKIISFTDGTKVNPGMATTSPSYFLIPSPNAAFDATTTLEGGTEGYGIQATTTGDIVISSRYLWTGYDVGGLASTSAAVVASSTGPVAEQIVEIIYEAAVVNDTAAATYEDTVTISCSTS